MPSVSKQQQKFMGIVRAIQKGDVPASKFSKKAQDAAKKMKQKDVEKYAKTKHKNLPSKVRQEIEEYVDGILDGVGKEFMTKEGKVDEGKWSKIMKAVRKGPKAGPWTFIISKNNKIKKQVSVKNIKEIPAYYEDLKKAYPNDKIGIEAKDGKIVYRESVNEGSCGYGMNGQLGNEPAGPHLLKKKKKDESTSAYKKSLEKIAKDRQLKMLSKKDKETLLKIAKMMKESLSTSQVNEAEKWKTVGIDVRDIYDYMVSIKKTNPAKFKKDMKNKALKGIWDRYSKGGEMYKEADLGLTYKKGKTVKVKHKTSGKSLIIIDKPNVRKEYEKIGFFAEGSCGYGIDGKVGSKPAGPHLIKKKKKKVDEAVIKVSKKDDVPGNAMKMSGEEKIKKLVYSGSNGTGSYEIKGKNLNVNGIRPRDKGFFVRHFTMKTGFRKANLYYDGVNFMDKNKKF